MKRTIAIITLILLAFNLKLYSNDFTQGETKQDTIILKNFWINPKYYQGDKRVYVREFKSIMQNDQQALKRLQIARPLRIVGYSLAFAGGGFLGAGAPNPYEKADKKMIVTGFVLFGSGLIIDYIAESELREIIRIYNKNSRKTKTLSSTIGLGFSNSGFGINATF